LLFPIEETLFRLPTEPQAAFFLAQPCNKDRVPSEHTPRRILGRQIERLEQHGLNARFASELEFYLFQTSYAEAHAKQYRELQPFYHFQADYDVLIGGFAEGFLSEVRTGLTGAGIDVEGNQGEGGPGQYEINIRPAAPLTMADQHAIFKHLVKALAQQRGYAASFMAKVHSDLAGSSSHVHVSLSGTGDATSGDALNENEAAFIAGLVEYTPELILLHVPYANSYRRLQPETFAPCNVSWAWDNRTAMVRLIKRAKQLRLEFRLPGADVNPYHCFAAILVAGIEGIERGLKLPAPIEGNAYEAGARDLPLDISEAVTAFSHSEVAAKALSPVVHRHLLDLGIRERDAGRRAVTDWDLMRGFERA
ncbi:MAG: glutamine synthetase family protein, partial [Gammaproteobacteria bacterium]|nr:glutamine synthetase family protein [Gammaproteobacteria bacterium]